MNFQYRCWAVGAHYNPKRVIGFYNIFPLTVMKMLVMKIDGTASDVIKIKLFSMKSKHSLQPESLLLV